MTETLAKTPMDGDEPSAVAAPDRGDSRFTDGVPGSGVGKMNKSQLARVAGQGALWQIAGGGWLTVIQLGASAVLARVLSPTDFGIMGMAVLAQRLFSRLGETGTGQGIIAKRELTQDDLSTAFWMNVTMHGILFLIALAAAPLVAAFFQTAELLWVMRVISLQFLLTAVGNVPSVLLRKQLHFGKLKIIECGAFTLQSALAVTLAIAFGMNYWALVISLLVANAAATMTKIILAGWLPRLKFNWESFRFMFNYGINGLGSSTTAYFQSNLDYLAVGALLGPATLGLYEFAYRIPHMIVNRVARPMRGVIFPVMAQLGDDDQRLAAAYAKVAKYLALITFPMLGGLAAVAGPLVLTLWGPKWTAVIVPLQILCLSAAIRCVIIPVASIFLCKQRPDIPFKYGLVRLEFTAITVGGFGLAFGLNGVAIGMVVSLAPALVYVHLAFRITHSSFAELGKRLAAPTIGTVFSSCLAFATLKALESVGAGDAERLILAILVGVLTYTGTMVIFFRHVVHEIIDTVRVVLARKRKIQPGFETK